MPPPPEPLGLGPIILVTKDDKSRVTGDCYARFCGSPGVRLPRATRPRKVAISIRQIPENWAIQRPNHE